MDALAIFGGAIPVGSAESLNSNELLRVDRIFC